jgi:DNA-binding MarR family transcriptional regulator
MEKTLTLRDYRSLADLRHHIRRFLHFSELAVRRLGLEPSQHQLLLALKGLPPETRPRIAELAERLQIRHHSTVELVDRLATRGYVKRQKCENDRREVLLTLTPKGERTLRELSLHHRAELRKEGPALVGALLQAMGSFKNANGRDAGLPDRNGEQVRHVGPKLRPTPFREKKQ